MKKLILALLLLAIAAPVAAKQSYLQAVFTNVSRTTTSSTFTTGPFTKKAIIFNGASTASNIASNMYGTGTVQCGATETGPYVTMKDTAGTAVSTTANAIFNVDSLCNYWRVVWTRTKQKINVWVQYSE